MNSRRISAQLFTFKKALAWKLLIKGSRPLLTAAKWYRRTLACRKHTIMVLGSFGKTTATRAARSIVGLPSSLWAELNANHLGEVAWAFLKEPPWHPYAVVEAGISLPGRLCKYADVLRPNAAIMMCIGGEHLRTYKTLEAIRDEKLSALLAMPAESTAILNRDDAHVVWMGSHLPHRILWFGTHPDSDVRAENITLDWPRGTAFVVSAGGKSIAVRTRLMGRKSVYPILAAIAAGIDAGVPLHQAVAAVEDLPPTRERLEAISLPSGAFLIDDTYKSTLDTVYSAFDFLKEVPARRRWLVMGHLNNLPSTDIVPYYIAVGEHMAAVADDIVLIGDMSLKYLKGLKNTDFPSSRVRHFHTTAAAAAFLEETLTGGDVALLKAHEDQGLRRAVLALRDRRTVRCAVRSCTLHDQFCDNCPLL